MKLKICGLKTIQDVEYVNEALPDYVGFVMTKHRHQIDIDTARQLKSKLHPNIKAVGVFVNESEEFVKNIVNEKIVDIVQFHGSVEYTLPCPTVKAFLIQDNFNIAPTNCDFVLFDTFANNEVGCIGKQFDWRLLAQYDNKKPFFLAGGINLNNLSEAIKLNPYCIDISSGTETNGKKDREKILEIVKIIKGTRS